MEAKHNKKTEYQDAYICGDCLDVLRGVPDNSIDLIMTSPPYADQIKDYGDVVKKSNQVIILNGFYREHRNSFVY